MSLHKKKPTIRTMRDEKKQNHLTKITRLHKQSFIQPYVLPLKQHTNDTHTLKNYTNKS